MIPLILTPWDMIFHELRECFRILVWIGLATIFLIPLGEYITALSLIWWAIATIVIANSFVKDTAALPLNMDGTLPFILNGMRFALNVTMLYGLKSYLEGHCSQDKRHIFLPGMSDFNLSNCLIQIRSCECGSEYPNDGLCRTYWLILFHVATAFTTRCNITGIEFFFTMACHIFKLLG